MGMEETPGETMVLYRPLYVCVKSAGGGRGGALAVEDSQQLQSLHESQEDEELAREKMLSEKESVKSADGKVQQIPDANGRE